MATGLRSKAVVLTASKQALQIWERDIPHLDDGCINVKVLRAGVCGTDPHLWQGDQTFDVPVVLGHEGLGQIIQIGKGVSTDHASSPIAIGDVVYWNPIRPCNSCYDCTVMQDSTACNHGTFWSPANQAQVWASYTEIATLLPNNSFYRVDQRVPLDAYIALGCALPTMLQAVEALGGIRPGCTVVVQGAGPVGLAAVMLSKLAGAEHIVCIEGNKLRLDLAQRFGVTIPVDMGSPECSDMGMRDKYISRAVGERGVNLVIECSGNVGAFQEGMSLLARSGKYLLVGTWAGSTTVPISPFQIVQKALTVIGSTYASPRHYYRAMKTVQANYRNFPLVECVTHRYELADAQKALEAVAAGEVIKAVIFPQGIAK